MAVSEGPSESSQESPSEGPRVLSGVTLILTICSPLSLPLSETHNAPTR